MLPAEARALHPGMSHANSKELGDSKEPLSRLESEQIVEKQFHEANLTSTTRWLVHFRPMPKDRPRSYESWTESRGCPMNATESKRTANYVGLQVEVIHQLDHCSLVLYRGREFVVDTADLMFSQSLKCAA